MLCNQCNNELLIDHVEPDTGKYVYVCVNPRCPEYHIAQTTMGEAKERQVLTKEEADKLKAEQEANATGQESK